MELDINIYSVLISISILLLIIELIPQRKRKRVRDSPIGNKIRNLAKNKKMKWALSKENSKSYKRKSKLVKASGLNITTGMLEIISIMSPIVTILFMILIKITTEINNIINNNRLQEIAKKIGEENLSKVNFAISWEFIIIVCLLSYFLPSIVLRLYVVYRKTLGQNEIVMLQTYTIMMIRGGKPVKQILIGLMNRSNHFKSDLERAATNFSENPKKALIDLRERTANDDFRSIVISLEQMLTSSRSTSLRYIKNNRKYGKQLTKIARKKRDAKKTIFMFILLVIPLMAFVLVGGYPWLISTFQAIDSVPF
ncbi:hypothetical protein [Senegalia massiliensis]|uniref:Type II secretion system protein GspF domain-containing protein n=1 Tax=Senegalia massiliensis TaxID=1720316 RepID=A0A845R1I9_9CLOT|nr:hypothetical protein [Senegalia massiliensis]NBI07586.1 hypothetical protein [Senegalia massiliensis]